LLRIAGAATDKTYSRNASISADNAGGCWRRLG
jgi:hypothetical protein